jgi:transcription initiation factor TFIIIB Brf1 subunit/transcription initiation factor TFIIB
MVLSERKKGEQKLVRAIVVLLRNTTWRCGRLERLIVKNLRNRHMLAGKPEMSMREMIQKFKLTGKKKNEFIDALRRLERRNIIRILNFP